MQITGIIAAILSTIAFLPQAIYTIKTKDTKSISLATYALFELSVILWFIYGIYLKDIPIMGSNVVCIVSGAIILYYKINEEK